MPVRAVALAVDESTHEVFFVFDVLTPTPPNYSPVLKYVRFDGSFGPARLISSALPDFTLYYLPSVTTIDGADAVWVEAKFMGAVKNNEIWTIPDDPALPVTSDRAAMAAYSAYEAGMSFLTNDGAELHHCARIHRLTAAGDDLVTNHTTGLAWGPGDQVLGGQRSQDHCTMGLRTDGTRAMSFHDVQSGPGTISVAFESAVGVPSLQVPISDPAGDFDHPTIVVRDDVVHVVYLSASERLWYRRCDTSAGVQGCDDPSEWSPALEVTAGQRASLVPRFPQLAVDACQRPYVAWVDTRSNGDDLIQVHYLSGGQVPSFVSSGRVDPTPGEQSFLTTVDGSSPSTNSGGRAWPTMVVDATAGRLVVAYVQDTGAGFTARAATRPTLACP